MTTKLRGYGTFPHRPRKKRTKGMCTEIEVPVATALKRLALSMDMSCASLINAILKKSLKL